MLVPAATLTSEPIYRQINELTTPFRAQLPRSRCRWPFSSNCFEFSCLVRPPDIVVGDLGFTAILPIYLLFSSATLRACWTELNQKRPHARKLVRFENECPKSAVYSPLKNGALKESFFDDFATSVCKFYILLHCHASHTVISKRNSTKLCQKTNKSRTWIALQSAVEQSGSPLAKNWGLRRLRDLMVNIF